MGLLESLTQYDAGIYAKEINGNREVTLHPDKRFFTASTSKIITAIALYHKLEKERLTDEKVLTISEEDKVGGSGVIQHMLPHEQPICNLVVLMLTISDNTAADILLDYVTKGYQQEIIGLLGLERTALRQTNREVVNGEFNLPSAASAEEWEEENRKRNNIAAEEAVSLSLEKANVATPADFITVLKELVEPRIISEESAKKILDTMKRCKRNWLIDTTDERVPVAQKTGGIPTVATNVGIVFTENPFYLVFMGKNLGSERDRFAEECRNVTRELKKYFNTPP